MQEIIVYRNPADAAIWHALSSAALIPIIAGVIMFFITFLLANRLFTQGRQFNVASWKTNAALFVGAVAGVVTAWWLWL
jgi:hypothetical protein